MVYSPTWISVSTQLGNTQPGQVDTSRQVSIGTIAQFRDAIYGTGEFIYLQGVVSTVLGSAVTYQLSDGVSMNGTTVLWAGTANTGAPLAFATAAIVANDYGWYQIGGTTIAATSGTVAAGNPMYFQSATGGKISATAVNGKQIMGAVAASANGVPDTNQAILTINRPHVQGQSI